MSLYNNTIGLIAPFYSPNFGQHKLIVPNTSRRALVDIPRYRDDDLFSVGRDSTLEILTLRYGEHIDIFDPKRAHFTTEASFIPLPHYEVKVIDGRLHDNHDDRDLAANHTIHLPANLVDRSFHIVNSVSHASRRAA